MVLAPYSYSLNFFMLFINSRFILLEGGKTIGYTKDKWFVPIRNFVIHKDAYKLYAHKNDNFSLTKNNIQIALYKKESYAKHKNNTYSIFILHRNQLQSFNYFAFLLICSFMITTMAVLSKKTLSFMIVTFNTLFGPQNNNTNCV